VSRRTFDAIYQQNTWAGTETRSGPGSGTAATRLVSAALVELVAYLGVESVVDAACGEGLWQPELPGYLGLDVSGEAVAWARELHPGRTYRQHDVRVSCPRADLVLCRDAMQHLSLPDGLAMLEAIVASGSRWLLASTYVAGTNREIATGDAYAPNLEAQPFNLPPAQLLLHDGYGYDEATWRQLRDPAKCLGLWAMPWW
jgi:hypothetical protein